MIDIKKEMTTKVDHPVPYLVDLVGRLVVERDKAVDLAVQQSIRFAAEFDGLTIAESQARKWVVSTIDDPKWKLGHGKAFK